MIRVYLFYRVNCIFVCFCIVKSSTFFFLFRNLPPASKRPCVFLGYVAFFLVEFCRALVQNFENGAHSPSRSFGASDSPFPIIVFHFDTHNSILFLNKNSQVNFFPKFPFLHSHPTSQSHGTEVANFGWLSCCWVFWPIFVESERFQASDSTTCFRNCHTSHFEWKIRSFVQFWW